MRKRLVHLGRRKGFKRRQKCVNDGTGDCDKVNTQFLHPEARNHYGGHHRQTQRKDVGNNRVLLTIHRPFAAASIQSGKVGKMLQKSSFKLGLMRSSHVAIFFEQKLLSNALSDTRGFVTWGISRIAMCVTKILPAGVLRWHTRRCDSFSQQGGSQSSQSAKINTGH